MLFPLFGVGGRSQPVGPGTLLALQLFDLVRNPLALGPVDVYWWDRHEVVSCCAASFVQPAPRGCQRMIMRFWDFSRRKRYTPDICCHVPVELSECNPGLALLCVSGKGTAQTAQVFDTENGLPHNRVNRLYFDSRNFLWVCTDDGLSRFDGHEFVNYTTADGLPHRFVNAVLESRTAGYWVATDGGLSRFDPAPGKTRFTNYAPSGPEDARHVNALIEDDDGSFLLATSAGLYRFRNQRDNSAFERIDLGPSPDSSASVMVNGIARDARHALWLATNHGLYQRASNGWGPLRSGERASRRLCQFVRGRRQRPPLGDISGRLRTDRDRSQTRLSGPGLRAGKPARIRTRGACAPIWEGRASLDRDQHRTPRMGR
jgi:hypothetical protein